MDRDHISQDKESSKLYLKLKLAVTYELLRSKRRFLKKSLSCLPKNCKHNATEYDNTAGKFSHVSFCVCPGSESYSSLCETSAKSKDCPDYNPKATRKESLTLFQNIIESPEKCSAHFHTLYILSSVLSGTLSLRDDSRYSKIIRKHNTFLGVLSIPFIWFKITFLPYRYSLRHIESDNLSDEAYEELAKELSDVL